MGESIIEATIINWHKKVGDVIEAEDTIVEVATDKVDSEIPSPISGTIAEILYQENEVVQIGSVIARITTAEDITDQNAVLKGLSQTDASMEAPSPEPIISSAVQSAHTISSPTTPRDTSSTTPLSTSTSEQSIETHSTHPKAPVKTTLQRGTSKLVNDDRFFSPLVRNIARAEGISDDELRALKGSGGSGRVTKYDLRNYVIQKRKQATNDISSPFLDKIQTPPTSQTSFTPPVVENIPPPTSQTTRSTFPLNNGDEIVEMDRMRKMIAQRMKQSLDISATVTQFVEADTTHLVHWRNENKVLFQEKYGTSLTFTPLFVEAAIRALGDYPAINAYFDKEDRIVMKRDINIGIATAMKDGNLIVPVIKNAGSLNLNGLTAQLNDLTGRARINRLKADEIQGGTFTISNIGTYGNIMGTPIINQPQLAILALGAIKKKLVVQETSHGDIIAIRHMMFLSLSFDHRVIDGYLGGVFLNRIAHYIEAFDPNRSI